jgi:hypothetical protein
MARIRTYAARGISMYPQLTPSTPTPWVRRSRASPRGCGELLRAPSAFWNAIGMPIGISLPKTVGGARLVGLDSSCTISVDRAQAAEWVALARISTSAPACCCIALRPSERKALVAAPAAIQSRRMHLSHQLSPKCETGHTQEQCQSAPDSVNADLILTHPIFCLPRGSVEAACPGSAYNDRGTKHRSPNVISGSGPDKRVPFCADAKTLRKG